MCWSTHRAEIGTRSTVNQGTIYVNLVGWGVTHVGGCSQGARMKNFTRSILFALGLLFVPLPALSQVSSINPNVPAAGAPLQSAPVRITLPRPPAT